MALIMMVLVVMYLVYGRDDRLLSSSKAIPAGLRQKPKTTLSGYIGRVWGGDNFEFGDATELHYCWLEGIDCPEPGQPFYNEAINFLSEKFGHKTLRMEVFGYDELKREYGRVFLTDEEGITTDVGFALIENGLAWYDGDEFEDAAKYKEAFEKAKQNKTGLWVQPSPVPPWDYWQQKQTALKGGE